MSFISSPRGLLNVSGGSVGAFAFTSPSPTTAPTPLLPSFPPAHLKSQVNRARVGSGLGISSSCRGTSKKAPCAENGVIGVPGGVSPSSVEMSLSWGLGGGPSAEKGRDTQSALDGPSFSPSVEVDKPASLWECKGPAGLVSSPCEVFMVRIRSRGSWEPGSLSRSPDGPASAVLVRLRFWR